MCSHWQIVFKQFCELQNAEHVFPKICETPKNLIVEKNVYTFDDITQLFFKHRYRN